MGKRKNADRANQQWFDERYTRAEENWSNYSKWTTLLQQDIDAYGEQHAVERGTIVSRLEAQGYAKDSPVYTDAIEKLETRQQSEIAEATTDLENLKTGATRDILVGDGSKIDATPYSEYLLGFAGKRVTSSISSAANRYAYEQMKGKIFRGGDDGFRSYTAAEAEAQARAGYISKYKRNYMSENSWGDPMSREQEAVQSMLRMIRGEDRGQLSVDKFYTKEYGVWSESPESIAKKKEIEGLRSSRAASGGQRAYKVKAQEEGMAGGRAMGSEFDLNDTTEYGMDEDNESVGTGLIGF